SSDLCAIVTGINTMLIDDPALTVRSEHLPKNAKEKQPLRVVLDRQQRIPPQAKILQQPGETLLIHDSDDLQGVLKLLAEQQCNEILVEAGATLAGAFVQRGLVDELVIYVAPTLLGSTARPLLQLPLEKMSEQVKLEILDIHPVGKDWRIIARPI